MIGSLNFCKNSSVGVPSCTAQYRINHLRSESQQDYSIVAWFPIMDSINTVRTPTEGVTRLELAKWGMLHLHALVKEQTLTCLLLHSSHKKVCH